jgi:hypothetical protein
MMVLDARRRCVDAGGVDTPRGGGVHDRHTQTHTRVGEDDTLSQQENKIHIQTRTPHMDAYQC